MKNKLSLLLAMAIILSGCSYSTTQTVVVSTSHTGTSFTENEEDIVDTHGKVENFERMEEFLSNIEWQSEDYIRIVSYTTEGDPIIQEVDFDGEVFNYVYDNTFDEFGSPNVITSTCTGLEVREESGKTNYLLNGCDQETERLLLSIPH